MKDYKEYEIESSGVFTFQCSCIIDDIPITSTFQFNESSFRQTQINILSKLNEPKKVLSARIEKIYLMIEKEKKIGKEYAIKSLKSKHHYLSEYLENKKNKK